MIERRHGVRALIGPLTALARASVAPAGPVAAAVARPSSSATAQPPPDGIERRGSPGEFAPLRHAVAGHAVALRTTPEREAAIEAGRHQIARVGGRRLAFPSQDLRLIESTRPHQPGQTHGLTLHVATSLADNLARLAAHPDLGAVGGYLDLAAAQRATDGTIANPANQRAIGAFLADPARLKFALARVDLGTTVGTTTLRRDVEAGRPRLIPGSTATVVLIKDRTFPEGYRVLTTYPDLGSAEVDAQGEPL